MRKVVPRKARGALWTCDRCGRPLANRNQTHACGRYTVEGFLRGKSQHAVGLYTSFAEAIRECGDVIVAPAKTRVGFQVRLIFATANHLSERGLAAHVVLARRFEHPRFSKIESISPRNHVHHFLIRDVKEIDVEMRLWLREAYAVGRQEHLAP
jgi:hypothetical protein